MLTGLHPGDDGRRGRPGRLTPMQRPTGLVRIGEPLPLKEYLRQTWARRDFIATIPVGQLKAQNQNSVLGNAWHLLNPLLLALVFYLVFGVLFQADRAVENFPAFLIIGIFVFTFTQKVVMTGARTVINNASLIRTIRFPRVCLPLASSLGEAYAQGVAVLVMVFVVILTGAAVSPAWLLVLPLFALQGLFSLGLAMAAARLTFHYRDVENLLPFVFRLWMYLSGVFFSVDFVSQEARARGAEWLTLLFEANPLYVYMTLARSSLIGLDAPAWLWLYGIGCALVSLVAGFLFFRAHEDAYGRA